MLTHPGYWIGFFGTMLLLSVLWGCDMPTDYTVHSPNCVLPPPAAGTVPLGCPYTLPDGTVVPGYPQ